MPEGLLITNGAQPQKQTPWGNIYVDSIWSGLWTNRSPFQSPGGLYESKFLGGRPSALLGGKNVEISVRNTAIRRFGTSAFSTATYPTTPNTVFSFETAQNSVQTIVDTGSTGNLAISSVGASSAGVAVYHGSFSAGGSSSYVGLTFQ